MILLSDFTNFDVNYMNLAADIGNSQTKAAIFSGSEIIFETITTQPDYSFFENLIRIYPVNRAIFSSVSSDQELFEKDFKNRLDLVIIPDHNTPLPLKNLYLTKETLGFDRIAAAVGAHNTYPNSYVLIIDAGTAITIDIVTPEGEYLGGNISPGIEMRLKALNSFTKRLPLVNKEGEIALTGKTTEEAIRNGVINGVVFELDGYIEAYKNKFQVIEVIFTGGDSYFFERKLKNSIFVDSNLNLKGLNEILEYNAK